MTNVAIGISLFVILSTLVAIFSALVCGSKRVFALALVYYALSVLIAFAVHVGIDINTKFPDTASYIAYIDNTLQAGDDAYSSARDYGRAMAPIFNIFLNDHNLFILFQMAMFVLSAAFICRATLNKLDLKSAKYTFAIYNITAILLFSYPAALLYSIASLREYVTVLASSVLVSALTMRSLRNFLGNFLLAGVFLYFNRPMMLIAAIASAVIARSKRHLVAGMLVAVCAAPVAFYLIRGHAFTLQWLMQVRESRMLVIDPFIYNVKDSGLILVDVIKLYLQFMLAPTPILLDTNWGDMAMFTLDLLYVVAVLAISAVSFLARPKFWFRHVLIFLIISGLPALWEFYIGGAVRHRIPAIIFLLPMVSIFIFESLSSFTPREPR